MRRLGQQTTISPSPSFSSLGRIVDIKLDMRSYASLAVMVAYFEGNRFDWKL
jgi:hypothetical protein